MHISIGWFIFDSACVGRSPDGISIRFTPTSKKSDASKRNYKMSEYSVTYSPYMTYKLPEYDRNLIADLFEIAADEVFLHGLMKKDYGDNGGPRCAGGHLFTAMDRRNIEKSECYDPTLVWTSALFTLAKSLGLMTGEQMPYLWIKRPIDVIAEWNDTEERTEFDVHDAFLIAAKELRNA